MSDYYLTNSADYFDARYGFSRTTTDGLAVHGLGGDDHITGLYSGALYGDDGDDTLIGLAGNDILIGGLGANIYIGGAGVDRAFLNGNINDYVITHSDQGLLFHAVNGSGDQMVDSTVEAVRFVNGQYLTTQPDGSYASVGGTAGDDVLHAAAAGEQWLDGMGGSDKVILTGNVVDYTLSRDYSMGNYVLPDEQGDFVLTAKNGSGIYHISESVEQVQFQNGQYLAMKDLAAYIDGSAALPVGGAQDDILLQTRASGYEIFIGGDGNDTLYLNGNARDYTQRDYDAFAEDGIAPDGVRASHGTELVATNGSGALLLDDSLERVVFQDGSTTSYAGLKSLVAAAPSSNETLILGVEDGSQTISALGGDGPTRLLLNGNAADYTLSRDEFGAINLAPVDGASSGAIYSQIGEDVSIVQFRDGQYLSLHDLPAYIKGDATFTDGSASNFNDFLYVGFSGDQYVYGGDGTDDLYLHGNVVDYTLKPVDLAYQQYSHPEIHGYELVATNGSGNIYIDKSTEVIHFQDGQYLAFGDLPAYIAADHSI